ncbi:MAG: sigma-70 family RNA polymerase sigma factor [Bacteroidota bacterium]|nr:sigma-70 family RNA polymerase sigma factor [Bacteroidota bacterium]
MEAVKYQSERTSTIKSWVEAYSDKMYSWSLYKTNSKETAEDLVQDTFMAAFQAMNKYEGKSDPKTWLFSILNNKIADHFRKRYRNPTITESEIKLSSEASFFETYFDVDGSWIKEQQPGAWSAEDMHLLDNTIFIKVLQSCLGKLPSDCHAAVQLKYLEEKKGEIICQELKISPTNFWQLLHRARLQLRRCLEIHWFKK